MPVGKLEGTFDVAVLEEYPGLVVRMPATVVVENAAAVRTAILDAWERRGTPPSLTLDMSGTRQIDSSGVGLLLDLSHRADREKIPISLCGLRAGPRRVLERTGIGNRFTLCESAAEARGAAGPAAPAPAKPRPRSHRALWIFDGVLALAIVVGAIYLIWQVGAYRGQLDQMHQLTPMQRFISGISHRLDAAEDIWRNWGHEKDALLQRFQNVEDNSRRQAENLVAASEQRIESDLDKRTAEMQGRLERIEAAQQAANEHLDALQQQLDHLQERAASEPSANRAAPAPTNPPAAQISDLNRQLAHVEEQAGQTKRDLETLRTRLSRHRVEFEMGINRARELAPGVSLVVSGTNVAQQKFDGRIWLARDKQSLWIRGQGPQQPLVFYSQKDDIPTELVVTRVTASSVSGYLLLPEQAESSGSTEGM